MTLLFRLTYATHANGTHHKLAMDALRLLTVPENEAWRRVFLKHAELYLEGSKAPDKEFKDFRNHVLHVGDNYWGGAPKKVVNWYAHTVQALKDKNWSEAVYCAGVLSHYYTDPIHPFHTAQSEAENSMHRAVEWSINRSYDSLRQEGLKAFPHLDVPLPDGPDWLAEATCDGAEVAHAYYEKLIAHYNLEAGVTDPLTGLDPVARKIVSELLLYATSGFSRILDRAILEADVTPPDITLTAETFVASLKIPVRWVQKKLANAEDKAAVQAMWDELQTTGTVDKTLSEDDRAVRDMHRREIVEPRRKSRERAREQHVTTIRTQEETKRRKNITPQKSLASLNASAPKPSAPPTSAHQDRPQQSATTTASQPKDTHAPEALTDAPILAEQAQDKTSVLARLEQQSDRRQPRLYLNASDPVEDGPSIGPKTATRLEAAGIFTVQDLFDCKPDDVARTVDQSHITPSVIQDWQDQARLVTKVPGLRGTHAQLLVGAGFRDASAVAKTDSATLASEILRYALTSQGQRILRDGTPPSEEKISTWVENARSAVAA